MVLQDENDTGCEPGVRSTGRGGSWFRGREQENVEGHQQLETDCILPQMPPAYTQPYKPASVPAPHQHPGPHLRQGLSRGSHGKSTSTAENKAQPRLLAQVTKANLSPGQSFPMGHPQGHTVTPPTPSPGLQACTEDAHGGRLTAGARQLHQEPHHLLSLSHLHPHRLCQLRFLRLNKSQKEF